MEIIKKDLSWWDYDKQTIIVRLFGIGFIVDDTKNVAWRIWHHEKTTEELFSGLSKLKMFNDRLLQHGTGYYVMSANSDIKIIFRYENYELYLIEYSSKDVIYKMYKRQI